jgi:HlyD family secretion protein
MSIVAIPTTEIERRRVPWALVLLIAIAAAGVGVLIKYAMIHRGSAGGIATGEFYTAATMDMDVAISKDGELSAVNNVDIVNPIEGLGTILEIAKEGSFVKKGDVVVRIDSSDIQQKIENCTLELQKAQGDLTAASEAKEIQESKNAADLEAAQVELTLARLDLLQYTEGDFPNSIEKAKTGVEMAQTTLKNKQDDLAQTKQLFGKGFVTAAEVKTGEVNLLQAKTDLEQKENDLAVLQKYTHEKDLAQKRNAVAQAEKKLVRVQRENASNLAQKIADLQAKQQTLALRKQMSEHLQEQLSGCTIKAPSEGMVVYATSGSGSWRRDTPMQPGAQVRQQELLIRLPDTTSMKVVCKINETQVTRLRVDPNNPMRATIRIPGQTETYTGWISNISVLADSSQRWWNPDSKDYPVDITLDHTPSGLKPGMGAEVRVFIDRLRDVLSVPLSTVYAAGRDSYVFVRDGDDVKPTKVALGEVNESFAQVKDGIKPGQQVLVLSAGQGRELLDKAGIKVQQETDADKLLNAAKNKPVIPQPPQQQSPEQQRGGKRDRRDGPRGGVKSENPPATAPTTAPAFTRST